MLCSDDFGNISPFINKNGLVIFCYVDFRVSSYKRISGEISTNTKRHTHSHIHTLTHTDTEVCIHTKYISNARLQCPPQAVSVNQTCDVFQSAAAAKLQSLGP